ncbi:Trim60 [Phodopus roborovskii]|uniref:Trim60 protein n=1 Tax=Phodopus roborovskii TaxID=109678 RepID=A0AAU9Z2S0_PHORO|nr:Trim60 [Phodopus roborovskii]
MDFSTALANLGGSCTCPICLTLLRDPVSIKYGDNFCHACLNFSWKDQRGIYPCPICPSYFPQKHFSKNFQICNFTDPMKQLSERRAVCQRHNQPLTLFCMEDLNILSAPRHRRILEDSMRPLECKLKQAEPALVLQHRRALELRSMFGYKKQEVRFEFEQLQLFMQNKHELQGYLGTLSDHVHTLEDLLEEAESHVTLQTSAPRVCHRFENLRCSLSSGPLPEISLSLVIERFQIDVMFDLDTAHPQLVISEDRKYMLYKEAGEVISFGSLLLGGKSGKQATLGVCQDSLPGDWSEQPSVAGGFWAGGRNSESSYVTYRPKELRFCHDLFFCKMNDISPLYTFSNPFATTIWPYFCTGTDSEPLKILPTLHLHNRNYRS